MCHKFRVPEFMGFGNPQFLKDITKGINRRQKIILDDITEDAGEKYQWY